MRRHLWTLIVACILGSAPAAAESLNKEGFWSVEATKSGLCIAGMRINDGSAVMLSAIDGDVDIAFGLPKPPAHGKAAEIQTETQRFSFKPDYHKNVVSSPPLSAEVWQALREAKRVRLIIDGKALVGTGLEGTGFAGALDAVAACSKGQSGWWGEGVKIRKLAEAETTAPLNKEGVWFLAASPLDGVCTAYAFAGRRTFMVLIAADGEIGLGVKSSDALPRGRRGLLEADATAIPFKPIFDGAKYFSAEESLDPAALAAVRNAKALQVSLDGRPAADISVDGTGLPALLDDLAACSKGQSGWWGVGTTSKPQGG